MPDALDMLENLEGLNVRSHAISVLEEREALMADLNASQMAQGLRATGTEIRPEYRPLTVAIKKSQKSGLAAVTDHVTLFDTGSHYQRLYADVQGEDIEFGSKDLKSEDLQKKYGAIYGLTDDSLDELKVYVEPDFQESVAEELGV